jgi:ubiquinone/menaquinone biosynthesis C-methylase UbiE
MSEDARAPGSDRVFAGAVAELYERLLVPMIFAPYAQDLARRAAARAPSRVLELAAGTGAATRALDAALPREVALVATDLNPAMLAQARAVGTGRPVAWREADAMALPFDDGAFDLVACQFGVMFFPDRAAAFAEARRVLAPGGGFLFNAWDRIEANGFADEATRALARLYPGDPPRFLARTPHGYHDVAAIADDLRAAGFAQAAAIEAVEARSLAASARDAARAYCQGTPLRAEIEARAQAGGPTLAEATDAVAQAVATRFGDGSPDGAVEGAIRAFVVEVSRSRTRG